MYIRHSFFLLLLIFITSCGSDSNNSTSQTESDATYTSQALLGPVVGADVEIYNATDLSAGLLCRTQTSDSEDIDLAGKITIPAECINQEGLYLLLISEGVDIDANDDGLLDEAPTQVNGKFHTLLTGDQLISGEAKATVLTEAAYQNVRYLLASRSSQADILLALNSSAQFLLKQVLNGVGGIDHLDLAEWHPRLDRETTRPSLEQLQLVIQDIHQNRSTAQHAVILFDSIEPSLSELPDLGDADHILLNDQWLYVANVGGLVVVDVSDQDNLQIIQQVRNIIPGHIVEMSINDEWLYVQNGSGASVDNTVTLYNVSDADNPILASSDLYHPYGFDLTKFYQHGDYGYAALHRVNNPDDYNNISHDFRLDILDLSEPSQPLLIASLDIDTFGSAMAVEGDRLYLGTEIGPYLQPGGLSVIDISNPATPSLISKLDLNAVSEIKINGDRGYALTASEISGDANDILTLLDLSNENEISVTGSIDTSYDVWMNKQLLIQGGKGYLAAPDGILVFDITDPTNPHQLDRVTTRGATSSLALSGSVIFAAIDQFGLQIFDMSGGASADSPAIVGRIDVQDVQEIATSVGNHAFLLSGEDQHRRIVSLDLSDVQENNSTSTEVYPDLYQNPLVIDQHLYATSMFSGVTLFDISDPMALSLHSNYDQSVVEFASASAVSESRAVVGGGLFFEVNNSGYSLNLLNVELSADPVLLSQLAINYQPQHIAIKDDIVFVAGSENSLDTYRISSSNELGELGSLVEPIVNSPLEIILSGQYGYLSQTGGLISVLDISDPSRPSEILSIDVQGDIADIHLSDNLMFIAGIAGNIQVLNVDNPEVPEFVGNFHTSSQVRAVTVLNNHLFTATQDEVLISRLPLEAVP
ncbi:MAG: hypothetical protein ABW100_02510 [Candidatus Thiodiazotropha sp. 6PLUC3]